MNEFLGMSVQQLIDEQHRAEDEYCSKRLELINLGIRLNHLTDAIAAQKKLEEEK